MPRSMTLPDRAALGSMHGKAAAIAPPLGPVSASRWWSPTGSTPQDSAHSPLMSRARAQWTMPPAQRPAPLSQQLVSPSAAPVKALMVRTVRSTGHRAGSPDRGPAPGLSHR